MAVTFNARGEHRKMPLSVHADGAPMFRKPVLLTWTRMTNEDLPHEGPWSKVWFLVEKTEKDPGS